MVQQYTNLAGKTVLITGATRGIGRAAAAQLAGSGASVLLACRREDAAEAACQQIVERTGNRSVNWAHVDLASLASIQQFVSDVGTRLGRIDVLINNAGVFKERPERTVDGHEESFAVNYLAPYLMTRLLLPNLMQASGSRVINVVSDIYRAGQAQFERRLSTTHFGAMKSYAASKLALVAFTVELAHRTRDTGLIALSVHPGQARTGIWELHTWTGRVAMRLMSRFLTAPEVAAATLVGAASRDGSTLRSGGYLREFAEVELEPKALDPQLRLALWEWTAGVVGLPKELRFTPRQRASGV